MERSHREESLPKEGFQIFNLAVAEPYPDHLRRRAEGHPDVREVRVLRNDGESLLSRDPENLQILCFRQPQQPDVRGARVQVREQPNQMKERF